MADKIEHVILLMLENRSFDHMLGFLDHPNPRFERLTGFESNPHEPGVPEIHVESTAKKTLALDPAHSHEEVMLQLTGASDARPPYKITNKGFVISYEQWGIRKKETRGFGPLIMRCQPAANMPTLSTLAKEFAVCTRWFCSVPGQTWPNRNFAHAATSHGHEDNHIARHDDKTIFETLEENGREWRVYHKGTPQVWAFFRLWEPFRRRRYETHERLLQDIQHDALPDYAFVEPDHFWPGSGSQHPSNNQRKDSDFDRAEALVQDIYQSLRNRMDVFTKTLFIVTYDEHGGFFDREPPPFSERFKDGFVATTPDKFAFDLLGPRVPAVLVSPWIPRVHIDDTQYDHSSIVATLRRLFAPAAAPLKRDETANTFEHNLSLSQPRPAADLPDFRGFTPALVRIGDPFIVEEAPDIDDLDDFGRSLEWLTDSVEAQLVREGFIDPALAPSRDMRTAARDINPATTAPFADRQERVAALLRASARSR